MNGYENMIVDFPFLKQHFSEGELKIACQAAHWILGIPPAECPEMLLSDKELLIVRVVMSFYVIPYITDSEFRRMMIARKSTENAKRYLAEQVREIRAMP